MRLGISGPVSDTILRSASDREKTMRTKTTIYIDDEVLQATRLLAAREGKEENEIFEEAIRRHLGLDVLDDIWARSDLTEDEALEVAYEELHRARQS
jgi:Arc/MetJ family transcription regulator